MSNVARSLAASSAVDDWSGVKSWIFDMDDTLYPREQGVMALVQARINAFIIEAVGLPRDEALVLQKSFLHEYGTSLAGLMANYAVEPEAFLREVHDVPLDSLEPSPEMAAVLARLPGRKFVFTNGARFHAGRVLARIGIADSFDGVFAIEDMDLVPKPAPASFRRLLHTFDIDPATAAFFEDTPKNLEPGKMLGMTTVLIGDGHGHALGPHIDHVAPYLLDFLTDLFPEETRL